MPRCLIFTFFLLLNFCSGAVQALEIQANQARISLSTATAVYQDPSGELDWPDIQKLPPSAFQPLGQSHANLGKSDAQLWFHFKLEQHTPQALYGYLEVSYPMLDSIRLYQRDNQQLIEHPAAGDTQPFEQRPVAVRNFWFPIHLNPGETEFWLAVKSTSTLYVPLHFSSHAGNAVAHEHLNLINGMFYGIILAMLIYNLFLFCSLREKTHFWYLAHNLSIALIALNFDGLLYKYLPQPIGLQAISIYMLMLMHCLVATQFSRLYLHTPNTFKALDQVLRGWIALNVGALLAGLFLPLPIWGALASWGTLTTAIGLMWVGFYTWRKGLYYGLYYVVAWGFLLTGIMLSSASSLGLGNLNLYGSNIAKMGAAIELLLLSLGLAARIKQLQNESLASRQAANEAETANLAKSRFLAKISHEIRTPLTGVISTLQTLKHTHLNSQQQALLQTVDHSSHRLMDSINDVLDYARIESGKLNLEHLEFDLEALLSDTLCLFSAQAKHANIRLHMSLAPGVPRFIYGDPTRLRQVLINLLNNALKFTAKGHVSLEVCLNSTPLQEQLLFTLSDTSIGIEHNESNLLFESLNHEPLHTTRTYGDNGLSLSICKDLIEMMGGQISCQSTPGQGMQFRISLTLHSQARIDPLNSLLNQRSVLICTTNEQEKQALELLFNRWQLRCYHCPSPRLLSACYNQLNAHPILVLCTPWPQSLISLIDSLPLQIPAEQPVLIINNTSDIPRLPSNYPQHLIHIPAPATVNLLRLALEEYVLNDPPRAPATPPRAARSTQSCAHILIVEDNHINQLVIQGLLRKRGYSTDTVNNGKQAVDQYCSAPQAYDLILMDCEMPELDGFEATQRIRAFEQQQQLPSTPIIAITAHLFNKQIKHSLDCGMNDFIGKPIDATLLYAMLEQYLPQAQIRNEQDSLALDALH